MPLSGQPTVSIEAEATHLPEGIEVSVEGLPEGTQILAKDLTLARGSALAGDPEQLVVNVTAAPTAEQLEGEVEEAAAEEAPADEAAAAEGEAPADEAASDES